MVTVFPHAGLGRIVAMGLAKMRLVANAWTMGIATRGSIVAAALAGRRIFRSPILTAWLPVARAHCAMALGTLPVLSMIFL